MNIYLRLLSLTILFAGCGPTWVRQQPLPDGTFIIAGYATDPNYGYTEADPIRVGDDGDGGPANQRRFLRSISGPKGEPLVFNRAGSCCYHPTRKGLLDMYYVTWEGADTTRLLYLDLYYSDSLRCPIGFTIAKP